MSEEGVRDPPFPGSLISTQDESWLRGLNPPDGWMEGGVVNTSEKDKRGVAFKVLVLIDVWDSRRVWTSERWGAWGGETY